jgi:hypothetical protein
LLIWGDPPDQIAEASGVDGSDMLDQNASGLAQ